MHTAYYDSFEDVYQAYGWPRENEKGYQIPERPYGTAKPMRVIHIGAGISGICMAKFLPEALPEISLVCYDKNADIGGTWLENRYPGCACDIPSVNYQFTWARNPRWSRFYSYATEIWEYLRDVVESHNLRRFMKLRHEIVAATWNKTTSLWEVTIRDLTTGSTFIDEAEVLINNSGVLNNWKWPDIKGLKSFEGTLCHTAAYDASLDLTGKRVAVIGMGSSGIQVTAEIANQVDHLYTWIRSPTWITAGFAQNWAGPNGANFEYTKEQQDEFRRDPLSYLRYCKQIESELNQRFKFILTGTPEAAQAKKFAIEQMQQKLNFDPELTEKLVPKTFNVGCRRPTPGNGFLEALIRPNVTTFVQGIREVTSKGIMNDDGTEHEVDVIICATGFDTSWVPRFPITANGKNVQDLLTERTLSYLSIAIPEIPNYWTGVGPYGPLGHGSFIPIIELITKHLIQILRKMSKEHISSLTPRLSSAEAFAEHADLFLKRTAWAGECRSWFKQGRLDGKLTIFPGSRLVYMDLLKDPRFEDYEIGYGGSGIGGKGNEFAFLGNGFSTREFEAGGDLAYYLGDEEAVGALLVKKEPAEHETNGIVEN